jgi:RNA recognition motif-containing protein
MATNLFVGNLAFATTSTQLRSLFEDHGEVADAQVITDRQTGQSRGFGFVEMASREEAEKAISALDGRDVSGRPLKVNVAKPRSG